MQMSNVNANGHENVYVVVYVFANENVKMYVNAIVKSERT